MKLKKAHVTNFRSVEDSEEFELDHTTCLVGKNEAGKTALLQAIAGLNPHPATPFKYDKERDYPRRYLTQYAIRHPDGEAPVVRTVWEIAADRADEIQAELGPDALASKKVTITRRYEADSVEWTIPLNYAAAVQHLVSEANFSASEKSQVNKSVNTHALRLALQSIDNPTEKHKQLLTKIDRYPGQSIIGWVQSILTPSVPQFMYFTHYDRMSGQVRLEHLKDRRKSKELYSNADLSGDLLFLEFLDYAGAALDEILAAKTYESFTAKLQAASNSITDQILEYWSQNPYISVDVRVDSAKPGDEPPFNDGIIGRARVRNELHRVDVPFSERSAGFIWFFSFLIKFAQVRSSNAPVILLLDEPGLSLHGKAQADLLRYFEEQLAPHHQIIYSTHSPFMVPPDKLSSARIVEDLVDAKRSGRPVPIGTKVRADVLSTDPDSVFPLQGALGYEITQTLFVGKHTLLVEGPSDILYLKALSSALTRYGRGGLDPKWVQCPSGGIGNIRPFVSLFRGNDLNIAVLADYARGHKKEIERLRESEILKSGAVLTVDQFVGKLEADTEDLFETTLFVDLLNYSFSLEGLHVLTEEKLDSADIASSRLVKKAEAYFRTLPDSIPTFDHYRPAEWLIENPKFLDADRPDVIASLDRAERLMIAINQLLA